MEVMELLWPMLLLVAMFYGFVYLKLIIKTEIRE